MPRSFSRRSALPFVVFVDTTGSPWISVSWYCGGVSCGCLDGKLWNLNSKNGRVTLMSNLDDVLIFVKVAHFESISRAARSLGMPISTLSRRLSVLESKLGVSLLRRTTRRVSLTAQGREYFNHCREPLALLEEAERVLTLGQKTPGGMLRMSVPVILGQEPFLDFLSGFLKAQPRIRIDLFITNLFLDLVAENIDVAIRFGELQDSSVVATRIGKSIRYVVAAAEYLRG